ncbi:Flp pilus assembly complex ATPase component TadA [Ruminiclostridium herbifermentans]|uniref:Flp pilus assembly complex ATPase component TadA n=1 Tax=Ruminiclostridium herbifermentans TaxID=2488810 RepID=A0A4V6ENX3_9FIRM|nr:ATPase, T2SS/T4P/T4SS family [Ruminiclostridium herbifermentans]QNU67132.1 Flp pilus assembly complex ATPase component TadA [Ruminiclostridium herbifermentans]
MKTLQNLCLKELMACIEEELRINELNEIMDIHEGKVGYLEESRQLQKLMAIDGSVQAREFMQNSIYFLLIEKTGIINSDNIDMLIKEYHIDYFENIYTGGDNRYISKPIDYEIMNYLSKYSISHNDEYDVKLQKLTQIIYQEVYGYGILDELIFDSRLNEVACTRRDYIWIQYNGIKRHIPNPNFVFKNEDNYRKIIENRLTSTALEEMNAGTPLINAVLNNGARVTALRPPLSKYYVVNIRLFASKAQLVKYRNNFVEDKISRIIELLASKGRRNVAIIGEQGSGKTTAADELIIKQLDSDISIGLAENIHELNISSNYPQKNIVELQYTRNFKPSDITEIFFRLNRDIVIYGEVRNSYEAFEMIKAMLRQARGSLFTFHSSSTRRMIHDLRQLLMQTGYYTDFREAQFDVADAVDLVVHIKLDRETGQRYVYKVSEVLADESSMSFRINDLFVFDKETGKYWSNPDGLSKEQIASCMEYEMTQADVCELRELFCLEQYEQNEKNRKQKPIMAIQ